MEKFENLKEFFLEHKYVLVAGGFSVLMLLGIGVYFKYQNLEKKEETLLFEEIIKNEESTESLENDEQIAVELCQVSVDVKGEIVLPGIYQLDCDSRVQDVIDLAGGLTWQADTSVLNLSKKVTDEMVIIVYSKEQVSNFVTTKNEEVQKQESCLNQAEVKNDACVKQENLLDSSISDNEMFGDTPVNNLISLNSASKEELMSLSGIGESKAENIILYREEHGSFKSIEEIKNVKGIGDSIFEKIKGNITV